MKLPYEQDILIKELLQVRPDTVVVLIGGSPVEMGEWSQSAQSIVWSYYAGMEGGYALAEVLFGQVNPSGKLPETFYKKHTDCSAHCIGEFAKEESVAYREGIFVGYRYNETFGVEPRFCFGHGLSYTEFVYEDVRYEEKGGKAYVICRITNAGAYDGAETVQVYRMIEDTEEMLQRSKAEERPEGMRPVKELVGFGKIYLEAGGSGSLCIEVKERMEGCRLAVGSSVKDIKILI